MARLEIDVVFTRQPLGKGRRRSTGESSGRMCHRAASAQGLEQPWMIDVTGRLGENHDIARLIPFFSPTRENKLAN